MTQGTCSYGTKSTAKRRSSAALYYFPADPRVVSAALTLILCALYLPTSSKRVLVPPNAAVSTEISDTPATTATHPSHPGYLPLKGRTIAQSERWCSFTSGS
jgi:hypothetical protein